MTNHCVFDDAPFSSEGLPGIITALARDTGWFISALRAVETLGLHSWCIGAGAVRNLVWDKLHGYEKPTPLADIDVAYFDPENIDPERDRQLQARLNKLRRGINWEVTNQAGVHVWYARYFGQAVEPLQSLEQAVGTWPEYATCVGITMRPNGELAVFAPHGLHDLFKMVIRRNPARIGAEAYRERIINKRYGERWPMVTVIPE